MKPGKKISETNSNSFQKKYNSYFPMNEHKDRAFFLLFNAMPQPCFITNRAFAIEWMNPGAKKICTKSLQDCLSRSVSEFFRLNEHSFDEIRVLLSDEDVSNVMVSVNFNNSSAKSDVLIFPFTVDDSEFYVFQFQGNITLISESLNENVSSRKSDSGLIGKHKASIDAGFAFIEMLTTVSNALPHPFYLLDPETNQALVKNLAALDLEANQQTMHCFMNHQPLVCDGDISHCIMNMVLAERSPVKVEQEYFSKNRNISYYEVFGYPVFSETGEIDFVICYAIDITEQRKNENSIRDFQKILSDILCNIPGVVYRCLNEKNRTMEYISPGCKKLTGYSANDLISNHTVPFGSLIHHDDNERVFQEIQKFVQRNRHFRIEYRIISRNGNEKWVSERGRGLTDQNGQLVSLEGFITDVTSEKISGIKLNRELQINHSLADIGVELLSEQFNPDVLARLVQSDAMKYTKSKTSVLIVPSLEDNGFIYYLKNDDGETKRHFSEKLVNEQNIPLNSFLESRSFILDNNPSEVLIINALGVEDIAPERLIGAPAIINNESAGYILLTGSPVDYTANSAFVAQRFINMLALGLYRIRAEKALLQAKVKAEESDRLKSMFLSNMSHEIRTPMNAIVGFAEMLHDTDLKRIEKDKFIDAIIRSGDSLLHLINDIIDISKIEAGQLKLTSAECNINELLNELELDFTSELERHRKSNILLHIQKGFNAPEFRIYTDPVRLRQVLSNLIGNAIKFTDEGFIEIGYRIESGELLFYVRDSGVGISPEHQKLIFERFGQVKTQESRNLEGTGLGLTISKNLVELLGGKIWVDSYPGEGSTFCFTLPLSGVISSAKQSEKTEMPVQKIDLTGVTILVVEDVDTNYFYISALLERLKAKVIRALNGRRAVEMCRSDPSIMIVLMDIDLPIMDGCDATRAIKQFRPELPVVAQTALAMSGEKERCIEAGCDEYLAKPIRKDDIIRVISKFIQNQS
jgi:PAS domain S-box-containing protein